MLPDRGYAAPAIQHLLQPLHNGFRQQPLLVQKRPFILWRPLFDIGYLQTELTAINQTYRRFQQPGISHKIGRGELLPVIFQTNCCDVGILPAGWDFLHHALQQLWQWGCIVFGNRKYRVQALLFLDTFPQPSSFLLQLLFGLFTAADIIDRHHHRRFTAIFDQ